MVSSTVYSLSLSSLLQTETATLEFRNARLERLAALTPADRKWVDEIVRDVNDSWDETDPTKVVMQCAILFLHLMSYLSLFKFQG